MALVMREKMHIQTRFLFADRTSRLHVWSKIQEFWYICIVSQQHTSAMPHVCPPTRVHKNIKKTIYCSFIFLQNYRNVQLPFCSRKALGQWPSR